MNKRVQLRYAFRNMVKLDLEVCLKRVKTQELNAQQLQGLQNYLDILSTSICAQRDSMSKADKAAAEQLYHSLLDLYANNGGRELDRQRRAEAES